MTPRALILRAPGINRDEDAAAAIELAGGTAERVHVNRIVSGGVLLRDYAILIIPGGFSYGDHLGAGKLLAVDLAHRLGDQIREFVEAGKPVIGICNGFQVLVKAGVLPGSDQRPTTNDQQSTTSERTNEAYSSFVVGRSSTSATLTDNASNRFECRWVQLQAETNSRCLFTQGINRPIEVPVAHGEGRFLASDAATLAAIEANRQVAFRYTTANGTVNYPANPNGSANNIAGVCNEHGNVLGLMPHPEDAILPTQHPAWTREPRRAEGDGLIIFRNAVNYAAK